MRAAGLLVVAVMAGALLGTATAAPAQDLSDLFDRANDSVVTIRAKGREVGPRAAGAVRFGETGSGVLVSSDGRVITAAHVVHGMNEIVVEVVGGDVVLEIDGIPVRTAEDLLAIRERLATLAPGSEYTVKALRGGKVFSVSGRTR